jgi:ferric-dicitrate binding protein FerR (iron transport regulator)
MTAESKIGSERLIDQAAEWFVRGHAGDLSVADRDAYWDWLRTSRLHVAGLLRMHRLHTWLKCARLEWMPNSDGTSAESARIRS